MWIWISPMFGVHYGSIAKTSLELDFNLTFFEAQWVPKCYPVKFRKGGSTWEAEALWCYDFVFDCKDLICLVFLVLLGLWMTESSSKHPLLRWQQKSPWRVVTSVFFPDNWVMRMQKMWSHLNKQWCKYKEASPEGSAVAEGMTKPGTLTAQTGSVQKNVSGMHMWFLVPGSLFESLDQYCCSKDSQ